MRKRQPEPPPAASTAVRERIEEYRAAHGGVFPKAIVVSREEFSELLGANIGLDVPSQDLTLKVMGVDIHVGNPTYPWGTFPTKEHRSVGTVRIYQVQRDAAVVLKKTMAAMMFPAK